MTQRKGVQPDLIDLLLADYKKPEGLICENGILKQLTKAIVDRALNVSRRDDGKVLRHTAWRLGDGCHHCIDALAIRECIKLCPQLSELRYQAWLNTPA